MKYYAFLGFLYSSLDFWRELLIYACMPTDSSFTGVFWDQCVCNKGLEMMFVERTKTRENVMDSARKTQAAASETAGKKKRRMWACATSDRLETLGICRSHGGTFVQGGD
ncbi:hypothetical protein RJT34_23624 [Clitoria ternatea]|uniref:Uncharacterized protein n=1 Tax=Clitoria ternatea TaxID=43366 RepID=A0AAN9FLE5_CLITE